MKKEIESVNNTRSSVSYHFDSDEFSAEKEKIISEYCANASIPGFRKGKAPKALVSTKFANEITSRVNSAFVNKSFDELEKEKDELHVLSVVDFSIDEKDGGVICKLIYDIRPDITLPDYKAIKLDSFSCDATDDEVNGELERIKRQHAQYVPVDREVRAGDYVRVNYEGKLEDGSKIADVVPDHKIWGKQNGTWEEAGNKEVPGVQAVIQGVIGHKVGDTVTDAEENFPEDFSVAQLAGKSATYDFELLDVRERIDPEMDEKFLKQYGVSTVDELKERIGKSISQRKRTQGLVAQRDQIVEFLSDSANFEVPESVVKHETQTLLQMFLESQARGGKSIKHFEGSIGAISEELSPMATKRAKSGLVLDKIAEVENITLVDKDVEDMLWQDAMLKRLTTAQFSQYVSELRKNRGLLIDLRTRALRGKVLDFLMKTNSKEASEKQEESSKK